MQGIVNYLPTSNPVGVGVPPLAVWQFDGRGNQLSDRTGNGRDLSILTGTLQNLADPESNQLIGLLIQSATVLSPPDEEALRIAQNELGSGDASLTLEAVIRPSSTPGVIFNCAGVGESLATNYLWGLGNSWDDAGIAKHSSFVEYGGGADIFVYSSARVTTGKLIYLALTISANGRTWSYYVNGHLIGSASLATNAQKSSSGNNAQSVYIGRRVDGTVPYLGYLFSARMTNAVFSAAHLAETYESLLGEIVPLPEYRVPESAVSDLVGFRRSATVPSQQPYSSNIAEAGFFIRGLDYDATRVVPGAGVSDDGEKDWRIGLPVQFRPDTLDPQAHVHFNGLNPTSLFYYRTAGEPWANPTTTNFTGYARDGFHYTNGVLDAGPVQAPWASESTSGNRSARDDFPLEALLVVTQKELVIFDLDDYPVGLTVWMRFEFSGTSTNYMAGGVDNCVTCCAMRNGTVVLGHKRNPTYGAVIIINFKNDGTPDVAHIVRSDNHWKWTSGYDLRDRNSARWVTTGVSPSLRINPIDVFSADIYDDGLGKAWVACAGDRASPHIIGIREEYPQWISTCSGKDVGAADSGNNRRVLFDESGWLWYAIDNKLFRAVFDYRGGVLLADQNRPRQKGVVFYEADITALAQGRNFVYVGTTRGTYRVHKATLKANLAYTIAGGGGGGYDDNPPAGEILVGNNPAVRLLSALSTDKSTILQVVTDTKTGYLGGVTTIRVLDDFIINTRIYPDIPEDYVYAGVSTIDA